MGETLWRWEKYRAKELMVPIPGFQEPQGLLKFRVIRPVLQPNSLRAVCYLKG